MEDCQATHTVSAWWLPGDRWIGVIIERSRVWREPTDSGDPESGFGTDGGKEVFIPSPDGAVWEQVGYEPRTLIQIAASQTGAGAVVLPATYQRQAALMYPDL